MTPYSGALSVTDRAIPSVNFGMLNRFDAVCFIRPKYHSHFGLSTKIAFFPTFFSGEFQRCFFQKQVTSGPITPKQNSRTKTQSTFIAISSEIASSAIKKALLRNAQLRPGKAHREHASSAHRTNEHHLCAALGLKICQFQLNC